MYNSKSVADPGFPRRWRQLHFFQKKLKIGSGTPMQVCLRRECTMLIYRPFLQETDSGETILIVKYKLEFPLFPFNKC